ncbi:MAG: hypothetical protein HGA19_11465 [Oscillochloris sp.]|nr:hypothetical protein [Oscillochloris sp.]
MQTSLSQLLTTTAFLRLIDDLPTPIMIYYQADIVILDITGVPSALLQAAQAVNLLGSQVALVGVGAALAQTFGHLGVDFSRITTLANLKAGIS